MRVFHLFIPYAVVSLIYSVIFTCIIVLSRVTLATVVFSILPIGEGYPNVLVTIWTLLGAPE